VYVQKQKTIVEETKTVHSKAKQLYISTFGRFGGLYAVGPTRDRTTKLYFTLHVGTKHTRWLKTSCENERTYTASQKNVAYFQKLWFSGYCVPKIWKSVQAVLSY